METISITEFKAKALALIQHVHESGQHLVVTKHGVPMARIVPEAAEVAHAGFPLGCMAHTAQLTDSYVPDEPAWDGDESHGILAEWDAEESGADNALPARSTSSAPKRSRKTRTPDSAQPIMREPTADYVPATGKRTRSANPKKG